jgi:hypothetical protein
MMNEVKRTLIMSTAKEIVEYIDEKYCLDVDIYNIAELINLNLGYLFEIAKETKYGTDNTD